MERPNKSHFFGLIFAGPPEVILHKVPPVLVNEFVQLKATIRGFPKEYKVDWMKGGQYINTTDQKYTGSMINCSKSVLCIRNVGNDDNVDILLEWRTHVVKGKVVSDWKSSKVKKKKTQKTPFFISFFKEYIEVYTFLL